MSQVKIVWFKRDLRIDDHAPLYHAAQNHAEKGGKILPLLVIEPDFWAQPDSSARQFAFMRESALSLAQALRALGAELVVRTGEVCAVLEQLSGLYEIEGIYAHQETHNNWTYQRDRAVRSWAQSRGIALYEYQQHGVIRGLKSRTGWAKAWDSQMSQPCLPAPHRLDCISDIDTEDMPSAQQLGLPDDPCYGRQIGGSAEAHTLLDRFLTVSGVNYRTEMSSPVTAPHACSRISPHLAWGTLSIRTAFQQSEIHKKLLAHDQPDSALSPRQRSAFRQSIASFQSRLHWHCHFIQKLEDQPSLEWENAHSAYDGIRQHDDVLCSAWLTGMTGYPLVDAVMRCLQDTGWINFRMRAMVMSFASYHLWLDWQQTAPLLARLFVDYEPGIHYSQAQMQSGTTGINTIRIYNPVKQSMEQDPEASFIRRYIPELDDMPQSLIHTPWLAEDKLGDYPMPVVDEKKARQHAASIMHGLRKNLSFASEADNIQQRHGSRKAGLPRHPRRQVNVRSRPAGQLELF